MNTFFEKFLKHIGVLKNYSQHSIVAYRKDLEQFSVFIEANATEFNCQIITKSDIRSWMVSLHQDGLVPSTINRKLSTLKSFFKFLKKEGVVNVNPAQTIPNLKTPKRLAEFVPSSDLVEMKNGLLTLKHAETLNSQEQAIVLLFYTTGIRRAELISLKRTAVDLKQLKIVVMGKRSKERSIPLLPQILPTLEAYMESEYYDSDNMCFFHNKKGDLLDPKFVYNVVNKYIHCCSNTSKASPHILRHSFATHLLNNGADINGIKELLGHTSLAATQVYTHNSVDALKQIIKKAHPRGE